MKTNIKNLSLFNMNEDDLYIIYGELQKELKEYHRGSKEFREIQYLIISIRSIIADRYQTPLVKGHNNPFNENPIVANPNVARFFK